MLTGARFRVSFFSKFWSFCAVVPTAQVWWMRGERHEADAQAAAAAEPAPGGDALPGVQTRDALAEAPVSAEVLVGYLPREVAQHLAPLLRAGAVEVAAGAAGLQVDWAGLGRARSGGRAAPLHAYLRPRQRWRREGVGGNGRVGCDRSGVGCSNGKVDCGSSGGCQDEPQVAVPGAAAVHQSAASYGAVQDEGEEDEEGEGGDSDGEVGRALDAALAGAAAWRCQLRRGGPGGSNSSGSEGGAGAGAAAAAGDGGPVEGGSGPEAGPGWGSGAEAAPGEVLRRNFAMMAADVQ